LLVRHGRGVGLTAAGARLLERSEMVTNTVNETREHVRAAADEKRGYLAVGLPPTMGALIGVISFESPGSSIRAWRSTSEKVKAVPCRSE
jgi:DNA-binding transcriptional LysR family regulator